MFLNMFASLSSHFACLWFPSSCFFSLVSAALALIHSTAAAPGDRVRIWWHWGIVVTAGCSPGSPWLPPVYYFSQRRLTRSWEHKLVGMCLCHGILTLLPCRRMAVVLEVLSDASSHTHLLPYEDSVVGLWQLRLTWLWGSTIKIIGRQRPLCSAQSLLSLLEGCLGWMEWT